MERNLRSTPSLQPLAAPTTSPHSVGNYAMIAGGQPAGSPVPSRQAFNAAGAFSAPSALTFQQPDTPSLGNGVSVSSAGTNAIFPANAMELIDHMSNKNGSHSQMTIDKIMSHSEMSQEMMRLAGKDYMDNNTNMVDIYFKHTLASPGGGGLGFNSSDGQLTGGFNGSKANPNPRAIAAEEPTTHGRRSFITQTGPSSSAGNDALMAARQPTGSARDTSAALTVALNGQDTLLSRTCAGGRSVSVSSVGANASAPLPKNPIEVVCYLSNMNAAAMKVTQEAMMATPGRLVSSQREYSQQNTAMLDSYLRYIAFANQSGESLGIDSGNGRLNSEGLDATTHSNTPAIAAFGSNTASGSTTRGMCGGCQGTACLDYMTKKNYQAFKETQDRNDAVCRDTQAKIQQVGDNAKAEIQQVGENTQLKHVEAQATFTKGNSDMFRELVNAMAKMENHRGSGSQFMGASNKKDKNPNGYRFL